MLKNGMLDASPSRHSIFPNIPFIPSIHSFQIFHHSNLNFIMKNILIACLFLLSGFGAWAQESGIEFHKDTKWLDLLAKAKSENKLIVVDAYTTWCGPCKWMDANVFKNEEVGKFYNANFINAKFDMEAGEGLELAKTYEVRAYPTILYIDGEGKTMHRVVGGREAEAFIEVGRIALNPEKRLAGLEKRLDAGERDPAFIAETMKAFEESMHPRAADLIDIYLETQKDWTTPENLRLIIDNTKKTDSKQFKFLLENRAAIEKEFGSSAYIQIVAQVVLNEAFPSIQMNNLPTNEAFAKAFKAKLPAVLADQASARMEMALAQGQQDSKTYAVKALEYYKKYPSNDFQELNEAAWFFYENIEDKAQLKEALKWAEKSVELSNQYFNNDTLASLYYKIGDKKNAQKVAEKAIALAKASGEDASATEALLENIKKMK